MSPELHQLLSAADEQGALEFPSGFRAGDLERRARTVWKALSGAGYEGTFEGFPHIQDASFSVAILLPQFELRDDRIVVMPEVRFSNFGDLVTILYSDLLSQPCNEAISDALRNNGFTFVPEGVLEQTTYDGVNAPNEHLPTWFVRYFDYI